MNDPPRTSPASRPQRADARRNRDKILAAADVVFAQGGAAASTEEVARRAGVAVGTVFKHFPTKQDLLIALMKQSLQRLAEQASELSRAPKPERGLFVFLRALATRPAHGTRFFPCYRRRSATSPSLPLRSPLAMLSRPC